MNESKGLEVKNKKRDHVCLMQKASIMSARALSCSVCGKRYKRAGELRKHSKQCSPCVSCGKVISNSANRVRHETRCRYVLACEHGMVGTTRFECNR